MLIRRSVKGEMAWHCARSLRAWCACSARLEGAVKCLARSLRAWCASCARWVFVLCYVVIVFCSGFVGVTQRQRETERDWPAMLSPSAWRTGPQLRPVLGSETARLRACTCAWVWGHGFGFPPPDGPNTQLARAGAQAKPPGSQPEDKGRG